MTAPGTRRPVTVVVPVYDDIDGLATCVRSLMQNIDFELDRVLLTNDVGPQADAIETMLLDLVGSHPGFEYHRNDVNLGFVGNCNRAVLELDRTGNDVLLLNSDTVTTPGFVDEMAAVLYLSPHHGVVAPRSNNATLASMPDARRLKQGPRSMERSAEVHALVSPLLPRFSVAPVAMGFCYLVKRDLIDRFGFFDEAFSPGYGEENDFCLRINEHGYVSLLANRAMVFHVGSTSFSGDVGPSLRFAHEKLLIERYPFYVGALEMYRAVERDPIDAFADTIAPSDDVTRIAVDVPADVDDSIIDLVDTLVGEMEGTAVVTVVATPKVARRLRIRRDDLRLQDPRSVATVFDAVALIRSGTSLDRLIRVNQLAPRLIVVDRGTRDDRRWAKRVSRHRYDAVRQTAVRYADSRIDKSSGADGEAGAGASLVEAATAPIEAARLRARWAALAGAGLATGVWDIPLRASRQRRYALLLASRYPAVSRRLRTLLHR